MICRYMIYFILLSVLGYFYECLAMTVWAGKWENRGFLYGPVIPIYGAGALCGTILFEYLYTSYTPMSVFLISMAASAILEYVVHYALEQAFHAYWWDYSKSPLNLNGRICLPASIGFGIAGMIIVYIINPFILPILMGLNETFAEVTALLMMGLLAADLTVTICVITAFIRRVESAQNFINEHMDSFVGNFLDESMAINSRFYSTVDKIEEKKVSAYLTQLPYTITNTEPSRYLSISTKRDIIYPKLVEIINSAIKISLVLGVIAFFSASTSISKFSSLGTLTILAPLTSPKNLYIANEGTRLIISPSLSTNSLLI